MIQIIYIVHFPGTPNHITFVSNLYIQCILNHFDPLVFIYQPCGSIFINNLLYFIFIHDDLEHQINEFVSTTQNYLKSFTTKVVKTKF